MSKKIKFIVWLLILIIGAGIVLALYYKPSFLFPPNTDNTAVETTFSSGNNQETEKTIIPNPTNPSVLVTAPFKATVFMDANINGLRDDAEGSCVACFMRQLVCSNSGIQSTPLTTSLFNISMGSAGSVPTEKLFDGYVCWATLDDKKIFIPPFTIMVGDSSIDVDIPSVASKAVLTGVNTHFKTITINSDGQYMYTFDLLIPVMQTQFADKKDIWIKYTPNLESLDLYYVKSARIQFDQDGSVTGLVDSYYVTVDWGFQEPFTTDMTMANYSIIM